MEDFKKINDEPIEIEYVEDEHDGSRDFQPSFWLAAAGYNKRYYMDDFMSVNSPWCGYGGSFPDYIHGVELENYFNPVFIEIIDGIEVNVYEEV